MIADDHRDPLPPEDDGKPDPAADAGGKKSMSTMLVELAQEFYDFGVSDTGETFGVPLSGPRVTRLLRGGRKSLRAQLSREFFRRHGRAAPQQALADALLVIEGMAQEKDARQLHLRFARHGRDLWLDLGDETGTAVQITPEGWTVKNEAPVLFKRTALNAALPRPVGGGDVSELWRWLNVSEADRPLVLALLASIAFPEIPHPVAGVFAEAGRGKSTLIKILVSIMDPSPVPARKAPRDAESWVTAASGSWVVAIDNLSTIPGWLSDSICRAVTGDGDVRRRLYTDADLAVFAFKRCIMLGGIDVGAIRGDLADRLLPLSLEPIPDTERQEEHDLWPAWHEAHPRILGAVLDLVAGVAGVLPSVRLEIRPRMADFARIIAAVDVIHGTNGMARFTEKQGLAATESLTDDPFIVAMTTTLNDVFNGTSADLLTTVTPKTDGWRAPKEWPRSSRQVTQVLRRQAPAMRKAGWTITDDEGANKAKVITWTIERTEMPCNPHPPDPPDPPDVQSAGVAGVAGVESAPSPSADVNPDVFDAELFGTQS